MLRRLVAPLLLFTAAGLQADEPKPRRTQISVPVWIEAAGTPAPTAKNVTATVGEAAARVASVSGPDSDLMLLIALDLAGDLAFADPARQSLIEEIRDLPEKTWVGVLRVHDGLKVLLDPARDRSAIEEAIRNQAIGGKAGLLDGLESVERVADSILRKTRVRVAIVYVTDSDVRNYREDFANPVINASDAGDLSRRFPEALVQEKINKLDASMAAGEAPVFIVHLNYRSDRLNEAYQIGLKQLAETTGGRAVFCRSVTEIAAAIGETVKAARAIYRVTVELPGTAAESVEIHLAGPEDAVLKHRKRFVLDK